MEQRSISLCDTFPFIRYAKDIYLPGSTRSLEVVTYDHRLFYVIAGHGTVEIEGSSYDLSPGVVLYWMSGTPYRIQAAAENVLHLISVNFDFTHDHEDIAQYLPMAQPQEYIPAKCTENFVFCDAERLNSPIILCGLLEILPYLRSIVEETAAPKSFSYFQRSNLMRVVLVHLCRAASQRQPLRSSSVSAASILEYIHSHYAEDLSNKMLAELFNYHPNYISQLIAEQTGTPLHQYIVKLRVHQALYLLQNTELPINEIACQVGYKNTSYFSHYFKQCTGHSPREYRIK